MPTCVFSKKTNCILNKLIVYTIHTNTWKNGPANPHKIRARGGKGSKGVSRFRELTPCWVENMLIYPLWFTKAVY